jgi:hypothetical protein
MKSSILRTLVTLGLSVTLGSVSLMAQDRIKATVPFNFTIGTKAYTAGEYEISRATSPHVLTITRYGGSSAFVMPASTENVAEKSGKPVLRFHRYGEQYFLFQVSDGRRRADLPKSPVEKELLAKRVSPATATLLASSK